MTLVGSPPLGVLSLLLVSLMSIPCHAAVQDSPCDNSLNPIQGQAGYTLRGDRCEGLYISPVTANSLEIVSLHKGRLYFDLLPGIHLEVSPENVSSAMQGPVYVRAVALNQKTYYRMDAVLPPDHTLSWPINDVLLPVGLRANGIGIFGWINSENGKLFVPIHVVQQGKNSLQQPDGSIKLVVRSPVDIENMVWRLFVEGVPASEQNIEWLKAITRPVYAGQPVTIFLPKGPSGVILIEVAARMKNSDSWGLKLKIRAVRPGAP